MTLRIRYHQVISQYEQITSIYWQTVLYLFLVLDLFIVVSWFIYVSFVLYNEKKISANYEVFVRTWKCLLGRERIDCHIFKSAYC